MTIGAGLTPTSPVAQKMNRLRFLASNLLDSIDYDENWDEEDLSISGITVTTAGAGEIVEDGEGGFTFNPADDFNGSVSFTYTVTDPEGSSVDVVRTIRVLAVNDAPELADGTPNPFTGMDEDGTFPFKH